MRVRGVFRSGVEESNPLRGVVIERPPNAADEERKDRRFITKLGVILDVRGVRTPNIDYLNPIAKSLQNFCYSSVHVRTKLVITYR